MCSTLEYVHFQALDIRRANHMDSLASIEKATMESSSFRKLLVPKDGKFVHFVSLIDVPAPFICHIVSWQQTIWKSAPFKQPQQVFTVTPFPEVLPTSLAAIIFYYQRNILIKAHFTHQYHWISYRTLLKNTSLEWRCCSSPYYHCFTFPSVCMTSAGQVVSDR